MTIALLLMLGFLVLPAAVFAVIFIVGFALSLQQEHRRRVERGFEVELNTGIDPVPEKKEIDHG